MRHSRYSPGRARQLLVAAMACEIVTACAAQSQSAPVVIRNATIGTGTRVDRGDPLEVTSVAEQVWIAGRVVDMRSRQTELRDRYLERLKSAQAPR